MAHLARAAGTDYSVAGGKTLIDGTAYNVVATREVENAKLVSGYGDETVGNYSSLTITINNDAFQWDKYNLNVLTINGGASTGGTYDRVDLIAYAGGQILRVDFFEIGTGNTYTTRATVDTSTNGTLKITMTLSGGYQKAIGSFNWYAALEAKS